MDMNTVRRVVGRLAVGTGLAIALSACGMAVEDPPRAMYGTTAWSDAWQGTCNDLDPVVGPKLPGYEHLRNDCAQYEVAQQMRYRQPEVATNQQR
jgi:hypothetical protein